VLGESLRRISLGIALILLTDEDSTWRKIPFLIPSSTTSALGPIVDISPFPRAFHLVPLFPEVP
jgi:hypothetical protein